MPAKVDRCVKDVYPDLIKRFKEKKKRAPSEEEKKVLKQSAWSICYAQYNEGGD